MLIVYKWLQIGYNLAMKRLLIGIFLGFMLSGIVRADGLVDYDAYVEWATGFQKAYNNHLDDEAAIQEEIYGNTGKLFRLYNDLDDRVERLERRSR